MRLWLLICIFCQFMALSASSQHNLVDTIPAFPSSEDRLTAALRGEAFFYNEEYNSPYSLGRTYTGIRLRPSLRFKIDDHTYLETGLFFQQQAQRNDRVQWLPVFTIDKQLSSKWRVVAGTIYGNFSHGLDESMYDAGQYYVDPVEYGLQFLAEYKQWEADIWIDWRQFIFEGEAFQEAFDIGLNTTVYINKNKTGFSIPVQGILTHRGGEIDQSDLPVLTTLLASAGVAYSAPTHKYKFGLTGQLYRALDNPDTGPNALPFDNGSGLKVFSKLNLGMISLGLEYRYYHQLVSLLGNNELLNYSLETGAIKTSRNILAPSIELLNAKVGNSHLILCSRGYYDIDDRRFTFQFSLRTGIQTLFKVL